MPDTSTETRQNPAVGSMELAADERRYSGPAHVVPAHPISAAVLARGYQCGGGSGLGVDQGVATYAQATVRRAMSIEVGSCLMTSAEKTVPSCNRLVNRTSAFPEKLPDSPDTWKVTPP